MFELEPEQFSNIFRQCSQLLNYIKFQRAFSIGKLVFITLQIKEEANFLVLVDFVVYIAVVAVVVLVLLFLS